jgi:hypothetical protein
MSEADAEIISGAIPMDNGGPAAGVKLKVTNSLPSYA